MSFPTMIDPVSNTEKLDFQTFETFDKSTQDALLVELKTTGTAAQHLEARAYFAGKASKDAQRLAQHNANTQAALKPLENRKAIINSKLAADVTKQTVVTKKNQAKRNSCSIS